MAVLGAGPMWISKDGDWIGVDYVPPLANKAEVANTIPDTAGDEEVAIRATNRESKGTDRGNQGKRFSFFRRKH